MKSQQVYACWLFSWVLAPADAGRPNSRLLQNRLRLKRISALKNLAFLFCQGVQREWAENEGGEISFSTQNQLEEKLEGPVANKFYVVFSSDRCHFAISETFAV